MKNIIFIEGVSGVGKSTIVNILGQKLHDLGFSVNCHFEGDSDNPLDLCWAAYLTNIEYAEVVAKYPVFADELAENIIYQDEYTILRYQVGCTGLYSKELHSELHKKEFCYNPLNVIPLKKFTEVFLNLWNDYTRSTEVECDYAIFDASLVSHMTNDLTRNYNARLDEIIEHLTVLLQAIHQLNPIIFYLSSYNVRERLVKARESRNQVPPNSEQIEFWEKRKKMDIQILPKLPVDMFVFDVSDDDWGHVVTEILSRITEIAQ